MAINYTISYTFSSNTVIASAQVNTNYSDNANTWTGLEALTKTFAKLKVDVDPTTSLEVATKQYADHINGYRRPTLSYSSGTVVNLETANGGTVGSSTVLFPDGNLRSDSTSSRINLDVSRVAALSGTAQSGIRTGTVTNNTWYAVYAVKTSDNTSNFVTVADTNLPIGGLIATLNSNFGTTSWVYLGMIRYGDQGATANAILKFYQQGSRTLLRNANAGLASLNGVGILLATNAGTANLAWAYAQGTAGAVVPNNIDFGVCTFSCAAGPKKLQVSDSAVTNEIFYVGAINTGQAHKASITVPLRDGFNINLDAGVACDITLAGWDDLVLAGALPLV